MTLKVSLEAMAHDVGIWHATSDVLKNAGHAASGIDLRGTQFSSVGDIAGVSGAYARVQALATELMDQGADQTRERGDTLRDVARLFNKNEQLAERMFKGVWNWKRP